MIEQQDILDSIEVNARGCWVWTGNLSSKGGYPYDVLGGRRRFAHRVAYELWIGEIPQGAQLDHRCRNHACCNPRHLQPVSRAVNQMRGWDARHRRMHPKRLRVATWLHDELGTRMG